MVCFLHSSAEFRAAVKRFEDGRRHVLKYQPVKREGTYIMYVKDMCIHMHLQC